MPKFIMITSLEAVVGLIDQQPRRTLYDCQRNYYLSSIVQYPICWPQFYTVTILEWRPLLKPDKYKDVIIKSLQHLTVNKKIALYALMIMDNTAI